MYHPGKSIEAPGCSCRDNAIRSLDLHTLVVNSEHRDKRDATGMSHFLPAVRLKPRWHQRTTTVSVCSATRMARAISLKDSGFSLL
jgi:hypothetical protein